MAELMEFSIITPSLNQGRFIRDCIASVVSQEGVAVEHIVVDAGSTDDTLEVLKRYPHLRWVSEPDVGMSDGINKGLRQARGEWVMWLNCDDYLLPGALGVVAAFVAANPRLDVVHGDCVFVDRSKRIIRRKYDTAVDEWDLLFVGCCIPSTATFFRRRIVAAGQRLDTDYHNCMDWEFYLRLLRLGHRFGYLPQPLAAFRWHLDNTTVTHAARMHDEGLRLRRVHLAERSLPECLGDPRLLRALRPLFQVRRVAKRLLVHRRIR